MTPCLALYFFFGPHRYAITHHAAEEAGVTACTVRPGEAIYIPFNWWHATLNLDAYNVFTSAFVLESPLSSAGPV